MIFNNPLFGDEYPAHCDKCNSHTFCKTSCMDYVGCGKERILLLGEFPSKTDDADGFPLTGKAEKLLKKKIKFLDYDLYNDFWISNAVKCATKNGKAPSDSVIKHCYNELEAEIKELKPTAILAFGTVAIKALFHGRGKTSSANTLSGNMIPLPEFDCWLFPLFPMYQITKRNPDENLISIFDRELKSALRKCRSLPPLPKFNMHKMIHHLENPVEIGVLIDDIIDNDRRSAVDFETSGVTPFVQGHRTFTVAITLENYLTYTFPIDYPNAWSKVDHEYVKDCLKDYLEGSNPKIAHNSQYEATWTKQVIGVYPNNFDWCTMVTQHLVDNRSGITGLKHQAFVRYGIGNYDKDMESYIKSVPGTNFNRMHKAPLPLMLLYNGMDSYLTMHLYHDEKKELKDHRPRKFFNNVYVCSISCLKMECVSTLIFTKSKKKNLPKK